MPCPFLLFQRAAEPNVHLVSPLPIEAVDSVEVIPPLWPQASLLMMKKHFELVVGLVSVDKQKKVDLGSSCQTYVFLLFVRI